MKKSLVLAVLVASFSLAIDSLGQDPNFWIFLCFGQSNSEGYPGIQPEDTNNVDARLQMLAAVDFPKLGRVRSHWYPAAPPLCRASTGLCPGDFFGRTLVSNLPPRIRIGLINVSVGGCRIELFDQDYLASYTSNAPVWMKGIIKEYGGDPYGRLVDMAKLAQKEGVIKGVLLHQGESNTGDKEWPGKVKVIYDRLMAALQLDGGKVPLLAGEVVNADQQGVCAKMNPIIDQLPETIPTAHVVSSAGCAALGDHLHFSPAGYRELGRRYAQTMLPLLAEQSK